MPGRGGPAVLARLSYEEIAQRLGVSSNMVKKYLSKALVHCRRRMARLG